QPASDERLSSVGRPTRFAEVAFLDEDLQHVADGAVGEICLHGNFVTVGYYQDPEASADISLGGWHHTGDLGYLDAEGYVHVVVRQSLPRNPTGKVLKRQLREELSHV